MDNGLCYEHNVCNVPKQPQPPKTPEELKREFAEKYFDVNNGEKNCFAPEDCYWRISDTNICTSPDKCDWNKDKIDMFLSDLNALLDKLMLTEEDNPYPETVFLPISDDDLKKVVKYLKAGGWSPDALFGHWGRMVWNNCTELFRSRMKGGE